MAPSTTAEIAASATCTTTAAATATAGTTTKISTTTTAATATRAIRAIFARTGLIHCHGTPIDLRPIDRIHRILGFFQVVHCHKGKALGATRELVFNQLHAINRTKRTERIRQA